MSLNYHLFGKIANPEKNPHPRSGYRGYGANWSPGNEGKSSMNVYPVLSMESEAAQARDYSLLTWPVILLPAPAPVKKLKC